MSLYKFIIDPRNNQKYSYNSLEYKQILKKYIQNYKLGGTSEDFNSDNFLKQMESNDKERQKKALIKRKKRIIESKKFK